MLALTCMLLSICHVYCQQSLTGSSLGDLSLISDVTSDIVDTTLDRGFGGFGDTVIDTPLGDLPIGAASGLFPGVANDFSGGMDAFTSGVDFLGATSPSLSANQIFSTGGLNSIASDPILDNFGLTDQFLDPITGAAAQNLDISTNDLLGGVPNSLRGLTSDAVIDSGFGSLNALTVPDTPGLSSGVTTGITTSDSARFGIPRMSSLRSGAFATVETQPRIISQHNILPSVGRIPTSRKSRISVAPRVAPRKSFVSMRSRPKMSMRILPKRVSNNIVMLAKKRQMVPLLPRIKRVFRPMIRMLKMFRPRLPSPGYPKHGPVRVMPKSMALGVFRRRLSARPMFNKIQRLSRPFFSSIKGRY